MKIQTQRKSRRRFFDRVTRNVIFVLGIVVVFIYIFSMQMTLRMFLRMIDTTSTISSGIGNATKIESIPLRSKIPLETKTIFTTNQPEQPKQSTSTSNSVHFFKNRDYIHLTREQEPSLKIQTSKQAEMYQRLAKINADAIQKEKEQSSKFFNTTTTILPSGRRRVVMENIVEYDHQSQIASTMEPFINTSIIVSGIAKNIKPDMVHAVVSKIQKLGQHFQQFHMVIYENNSQPSSRKAWEQALITLNRTTSFTFVSEAMTEQEFFSTTKSRTERIADARNEMMKIIHEPRFQNQYEYLIVTDLDGVCHGSQVMSKGYDPYIFQQAIEQFQGQWDALSFRASPVSFLMTKPINFPEHLLLVPSLNWGFPFSFSFQYFDRWAFREENVMPFNSESLLGSLNPIKTPEDMEHWIEALDPTILTPVMSAFMMLSIYRMNITTNIEYSAIDASGTMDCEHVAFHKSMIDTYHARIRLWPGKFHIFIKDKNLVGIQKKETLYLWKLTLYMNLEILTLYHFLYRVQLYW